MPLTPIGLPYPTPDDPLSLGANDIRALAEAIDARAAAYSTTPPAAPAAGTIWNLPLSGGGVWTFRYNPSAATYKWEYIGGARLAVDATGGAGVSATGAANRLEFNPAGPSLVCPRAGLYDVTVSLSVYISAVALTRLDVYAIAAPANVEGYVGTEGIGNDAAMHGLEGTVRLASPASAPTVRMVFSATAGSLIQPLVRHLSIVPVAVA